MKSNTKLSRNCLKMLLCLVFLFPLSSFSQTIIPMPMYYGEGGSLTHNQALSMLIALNIPMILIFLFKSALWIFKLRKDYSFFECAIWSDADSILTNMNTICFSIINGIAIIIYLAVLIEGFLK